MSEDRIATLEARLGELHADHKSLSGSVDELRTKSIPEIGASLARIETKLDERTDKKDNWARVGALVAGAAAAFPHLFGGGK